MQAMDGRVEVSFPALSRCRSDDARAREQGAIV